ncbi:HEPN domain-containing protein [Microbacterium sp. NPDC079208]|uniref:HEPN domain-containing protein n=1 Tax=unclassified Microbacterium TaxID=2609290 RepID=UPI00344D9A9E
MALFSTTYEWPSSTFEFRSTSEGARDGTAEVLERGGRWILKSPGSFSGASGQPGQRTLSASLDDSAAFIRGHVVGVDRDLGMRVDEIWVGETSEIDARYVRVTAKYEHLADACAFRFEDGEARDPSVPLRFTAVGEAPAVDAVLDSRHGMITLVSSAPAPLEQFEKHLEIFQAMLTFGADKPCGRLTMVAEEHGGAKVTIFGRDKYAPFGKGRQRPVEFTMRLGAAWTQRAIDRWWLAYDSWLPVLQIVSGLRYQPGYVDADVILSSAAIEAVSTQMQQYDAPRLSPEEALPIITALDSLSELSPKQREAVGQLKGDLGRTTFRSKVEQVLTTVPDDVWLAGRVSRVEWIRQFMNARNKIAHAGASPIWKNSPLLRSVRDANWIVLSLVLLAHLQVPTSVLDRSAERLGNRYANQHREGDVFL